MFVRACMQACVHVCLKERESVCVRVGESVCVCDRGCVREASMSVCICVFVFVTIYKHANTHAHSGRHRNVTDCLHVSVKRIFICSSIFAYMHTQKFENGCLRNLDNNDFRYPLSIPIVHTHS